MKAKAAVDQFIPDFRISEGQLKRWFRGMKGKQLRPCTKPCLTEEYMAAHVRYSTRVSELIVQQKKHILRQEVVLFHISAKKTQVLTSSAT
jgi:hypothetical protein